MRIPVSIIICTRNRAEHLHQTLQSVNRVFVPAHLEPELLVVDNGSTDETQEILSNPPVRNMPTRSFTEPQKGASRARNKAIQVSNSHILLWLDDDVRAPSDWLNCMTRPLLEDQAEVIAGKVKLAPHLNRSWMEPFHRCALASTESINSAKPRNVISANMALKRNVLERVPRFDPELGPGGTGTLEDILFSWQLVEAGYGIKMVAETAVEHHFDESRLTRDAFVRAAIDRGKSLSYIQYHWLHLNEENWTNQLSPLQVWRKPLFILSIRFLRAKLLSWVEEIKKEVEPISKREFWEVMNVSSLKKYIEERRRKRNYKHKGLKKLD